MKKREINPKRYKKEVKQHIKFDKQNELQGAANSSEQNTTYDLLLKVLQ